MNLEASIQFQGIACQQAVAGYTFQVLTDGTTFPGRIDPQPSIDPRQNLGSDPREYAVIYALRKDIPNAVISPAAASQTRIAQLDAITNAQVGEWMLVNRDDNPADPAEVKLWVTKVTANDL